MSLSVNNNVGILPRLKGWTSAHPRLCKTGVTLAVSAAVLVGAPELKHNLEPGYLGSLLIGAAVGFGKPFKMAVVLSTIIATKALGWGFGLSLWFPFAALVAPAISSWRAARALKAEQVKTSTSLVV
jgi:hypothetical protein